MYRNGIGMVLDCYWIAIERLLQFYQVALQLLLDCYYIVSACVGMYCNAMRMLLD